jgi:hypothetical protein
MKTNPPIFLTAEWRYLAMLNYEIDPAILTPFIPAGTELDVWEEKTFVSVVGFLFQKTRVRGIRIPFHENFEELNLRFYVRRKAEDGWRRGVVFIKELVPRAAIALVARIFYNENYIALPMSHQIEQTDETVKSVNYSWQFDGAENHLKLETQGAALSLVEGSAQEFITEHYWGYARQRDGGTIEYKVEHPRWRVWESRSAELHADVAALYGEVFRETLSRPPSSAFLAEGSPISVFSGVRIG